MKLGDLVRWDGRYWIVRRYDPKRTRTSTLQDWEGRLQDVAFDSDEVEVIANPGTEWPFVMLKDNPKGVRIKTISRIVNHAPLPITRATDWVPSDPTRPGGALFLNPSLGLKTAETLLIEWEAGMSTSIRIPSGFATMFAKVARAEAARAKPVESTAYDALLRDDKFGGDDE